MANSVAARQTLIDNPPQKCPYFTLPDVCHFPKEIRVSKARRKTNYVSIVSLWGPSNKMTEETTTDFLLQLLKHSEWEPDFKAVAAEWQLNSTSYIQSRLKSIVESKGYKLIGESKIVDGNDGPPKPAAPPSKKIKAKENTITENDADNEASKVTKPSKPKKRKASDSAEVSKSKAIKKQRRPAEGTWTTPENLAGESPQCAAEDGGAEMPADPVHCAHKAGAENVGS